MGTLDGPGVRFVVFMQGCNLRCGFCHNPDTWEMGQGSLYTSCELVKRATRYKEYFGKDGGVTVSGGEPLLQPKFVRAFFEGCHEDGINTCLDTSGSILNEEVKLLIDQTDRVLLDIKYHTDELYKKNVGCSLDAPLAFLEYLQFKGIPVTLRQVITPTINDNEENIDFLLKIIAGHSCIDSIELLPFKKICAVKYESLGIAFPFARYRTPEREEILAMEAKLSRCIK